MEHSLPHLVKTVGAAAMTLDQLLVGNVQDDGLHRLILQPVRDRPARLICDNLQMASDVRIRRAARGHLGFNPHRKHDLSSVSPVSSVVESLIWNSISIG